MKKIGSLCLALVMLMSVININMVYADSGYNKDSIDTYVGEKIIDLNYYHKLKGYYPYTKRLDKNGNMQCVGYVYARLEEKLGLSPDFGSGAGAKDIPDNAPNGQTRTAYDGTNYTIEVFKNDNGSHIMANSWVSFGAGSSRYGHVIYIEEVIGDTIYYSESGTSMWRNGTAGILKKKSRYDFINNCSSGGSYIGTVVFRGSASAYSHGRVDSNTSNDDSALSIDLTSYPTSLKQGSNFGLRGTISSANELKRIEGFIKKGNDTVQSTTDYPNKTSVNVKGINLNKNLIFDNLGTGDYTLIVSATDSTGKTVTVKKNFSVYAEQTRADSSLSINLTRYPVTLDAGTSFGLRGSVDSNYTIARVRGYVKDSNGSVVLSSNDTPGSTSMNIQYADLNNSLVFNRLSPGSYTMIVEATDTSGRVVTATKDFSVRSKETYTDNSSSGSGVDGTVQIPSSWDDLSIRTGPSTDYTIVGSMPQGARCTVYPDRTVNGWYYVNYNGIWGYASGRQINLNSGGSAPSNTRVGIINIPSSWDDLSIRTGPSTDYTIVGSMPQGARCTVYPDKASGGWYYVEYNGVQGYAAGNRINLQ